MRAGRMIIVVVGALLTTAGFGAAAVIMVAVFAVLGTLSMQDFKQLGVGLAVAILLDATIVRGVLLPSVLTLLGDRTWYLPRWLSWLPKPSRVGDIRPDGSDQPSPTDAMALPRA